MQDNPASWKSTEAGRECYRTLRDEHGFAAPQIQLLMEDHFPAPGKNLSADDIARRVKFGLIEVPDEDRASAVLRRRENQRIAEKRRTTIARKRRERCETECKVTPLWSPSHGKLFP